MHRVILEQEDELRYVFLLLHPSEFNKEAIKTIMYDGKITVSDGEMVFYAPYSALFTAYHDKFQNREMWGVGFLLSLLKHCEKWKIAERYGYSVDGDLQSWKVESNIIDFQQTGGHQMPVEKYRHEEQGIPVPVYRRIGFCQTTEGTQETGAWNDKGGCKGVTCHP